MKSWAEQARESHDGHWTVAIEQKYRFLTAAAESLVTENTAARKKLPPNTYTGNLPCFLHESRYVSLHARGEPQREILARIKDLGYFVTVFREFLPPAEMKKLRKNALEIDLKISGDNKIGLFYLCNVLEKYDQTCLALHQHAKKLNKALPVTVRKITIRDWRADYVNYVRRRSRGIFQNVRLAYKDCARAYDLRKHAAPGDEAGDA